MSATPPPVKGLGLSMPRERYQRGHIKPVGKHTKKWRGWWFTYERKDGKEVRVHHSQILGLKAGMTKGEAQAKLDAIIQAATSQTPSKAHGLTVAQLFNDVFMPIRSRKWSPNTRTNYASCLKNHILPDLGAVLIGQIKKAQIEKHLAALVDRGLGADTVTRAASMLHAALEEAVENEYITKNPARKLTIPEIEEGETRALTPEEVSVVFSKLSGRDRLIWRILILCGARAFEPFALRRDDLMGRVLRIDEQLRCDGIKHTKDDEVRFAPLPASLRVEIEHWAATQVLDESPSALLFNSTSRTAEYDRLKVMRTLTGIADLKYSMGRRTFSTYYQGDPKDVQGILGHAKIQTTMEHYKKIVPERQLASVEALDALFSGSELVTIGHRFSQKGHLAEVS